MASLQQQVAVNEAEERQPFLEGGAHNTFEVRKKARNSPLQSYFTFVAAFTGAGILALPYGFKEAGLLAGCIGLILLGLASNITLKLLALCKTKNNHVMEIHTYADIGKACYGKTGVYMVNASILMSQFGFCCAYLIFIADNIGDIANLSPHLLIFCAIPVVTILVWVRNIKILSHTSILANIAVMIAVIVVFEYGFSNKGVKSPDQYTYFKVETFPIFYGIVCFAFTVHGLALDVQASMKDASWYNRVVDLAVFFVTTIYVVFGALSYMFFRDDTDSEITLNLGDNTAGYIVKISISTVLVFAYPLQLYPVVQMVESAFIPPKKSWTDTAIRNIVRLMLVVLTAAMARSIPYFGLFASFVGSFSNSFISFIFPALFYLKLFGSEISLAQKLMCGIILVLGITGMAVGTTICVLEIIDKLT